MKKKALKIFNVVIDILIILVLIVSVFTLISVFATTKGGEGVPNLFGKAPISVLTDSMAGDKEDNFNKGDLLICDVVDSKNDNKYEVGDIVTFRQDINGDGNADLVTHRLYEKQEDGSFFTKGDANDTYDQNPANATVFNPIYSDDILAVYHGSKINGVGNFVDFIRSPLGFFICILLPMIIFFIYQAIRVIINAMAYSKEKGRLAAEEAINKSELTEEQKAKAIAEYLEQQKGKQKAEFDEEKSDPDDSEKEEQTDQKPDPDDSDKEEEIDEKSDETDV